MYCTGNHQKTMLKWFFIWKAWRQQKDTTYAFDKRKYRHRFGAGFFAFLERSRFWDTDPGPFQRQQRRRRLSRKILVLVLLGLGIWVLIDGISILRLF